jgi:hypothetical protein
MINEPTALKAEAVFLLWWDSECLANYRWDARCTRRRLKVSARSPWSRFYVKNLIVAHLAKIFSAFY